MQAMLEDEVHEMDTMVTSRLEQVNKYHTHTHTHHSPCNTACKGPYLTSRREQVGEHRASISCHEQHKKRDYV